MENVPWKQAIKEDVKQFECLETFYEDDLYEYKNLTLADIILKNFPLVRLLEEHELRAMGIRQSPTWVHYANREPDVMLFRRPRRDNREETKNQQKQDEEPPAEEGDTKNTKNKRDEDWRDAIPLIQYSVKYYDDNYEYRHVILPEIIVKTFPLVKVKLMEENEWREMGVQQSRGWLHYAIHRPEPHIMLFRRPPQQKNRE